jgi:hypothetical protein
VFGKWGLFVLAALASAAVLTSSAGAVSQGSVGVKLSTRAGVVQYLASLGVDARGIVVQRGSHNYAGPNCPGRGWTCTTAKRVLQISTKAGDDNSFVCTASTFGSATPPGDCTIIQSSAGGGDNVARCVERSGDASANQSCRVSQVNDSGANRIVIQQQVDAKDGATQFASQYAGATQTNISGPNSVQINQDLKQSAKVTEADGSQTQDGHQGASVTQSSDTGNNSAKVDQSLALKAEANGGTTITQSQNTNPDANTGQSINSNAGVVQSSNSGRNDANVNQSNDYDAHVGKADTATQTQGSSSGGENTFFLQTSSGVSTAKSQQHEHQDLHAEHVTNLTQNQFGPLWNDPDQSGNPNDRWDINQDSNQRASNPNTQDDLEFAECSTDGNCTVDQRIQQQGQNFTTPRCSSTTCTSVQEVVNGESVENPCDGECSPPRPPLPPFPNTCEFSCDVVGISNHG